MTSGSSYSVYIYIYLYYVGSRRASIINSSIYQMRKGCRDSLHTTRLRLIWKCCGYWIVHTVEGVLYFHGCCNQGCILVTDMLGPKAGPSARELKGETQRQQQRERVRGEGGRDREGERYGERTTRERERWMHRERERERARAGER